MYWSINPLSIQQAHNPTGPVLPGPGFETGGGAREVMFIRHEPCPALLHAELFSGKALTYKPAPYMPTPSIQLK